MTAVRDLNTDDRARLAALLIEQVGMAAVDRMRDGITVLPPPPGAALLACRCGAVLDAADMHRQDRGPTTAAVARITCKECA